MKLLFISDIHGLKTNLPKIKERFLKLQCDKLVVLGDLYYIYPKYKDLPDYDPSCVKEFLEKFKDKLICIRGNCDSEFDVLTSNFQVTKELAIISTTKHDLYLTHGHIYNEQNWSKKNSILIYGHLHRPFIKEISGNIYINTGSISLPKNTEGPTYLFYNEDEFVIYDINDHVLARKNI